MPSPLTESPLTEMSKQGVTALWNDSADPRELSQSIEWGAVGATCNPVIALAAINADLDRWTRRIAELAEKHPTASETDIGWLVVEEVSLEAAALLRPAFDKHRGRNGRLSMQTNPRFHRDPDALVAQAVHFSSLAPNIIVKIPATTTGLVAIEEAVTRGVSVNVTVSFSVPQALASAEAIERGLIRREQDGHDISTMGHVVTIMCGRLDDWLKDVVVRDQLDVDAEHLEWAGIAAFKRAYEIFQERGFRARLLSAAFRNTRQWSELVGGDVVISPPFAWQQRIQDAGEPPSDRIAIPVDPATIEALRTIPDFVRAYEPDGMTPDEFADFGPTRKTLRQFLDATDDLDQVVRDVIVPDPLA